MQFLKKKKTHIHKDLLQAMIYSRPQLRFRFSERLKTFGPPSRPQLHYSTDPLLCSLL